MKKIYISLLIIVLSVPAFSQTCNGLRYRDFVFQDSSVTNIVYGSNISSSNTTTTLKMDVWMPKADTGTNRPLIILMHGGNFLGGSKSGSDVLQFSKDFAKMGYVVASIDYRVGMTNFPLGTPDSVDAAGSVIRAVHDGKAAIRYFKKDFATNGNQYRIDTSKIFFLGVSAGAITGLHMAYMDTMSEFPLYADTTNHYGLHGGLEGLSGNPGYSSSFRGLIEICGAIGDTSWIAAGNMPAALFHGDQDNTVPYGSDIIYLLGTYPLLQVDGSHSVDARLTNLGIEHCFETYEGQDHVPEVGTSAAALAYYDTTLVKSRNFLVHYTCGDPLDCSYTTNVAVNNLPALPSLIEIYPNPAENKFSVNLERLAGSDFSLEMYDAEGKLIENRKNLGNEKIEINTENLPSGIYFIKVNAGDNVYLLKEVVK
ncbi:MAG TPA: T9SS type A sorting domain-containing protein [Bacteroidia bacterium]|nr:T9SS type A sorting domain-containing protein [Bacteroidia bacterium]